jgi:hypothetical protein
MNDPMNDDLLPEHVEIDAYLRDSRRKLTKRLASQLSPKDGLAVILHGDPMAVRLIRLRIRARDLANTIDQVRDLVRDLNRVVNRVTALDGDLISTLVDALDRGHKLADILASELASGLSGGGGVLDLALSLASQLADALGRERGRAVEITRRPGVAFSDLDLDRRGALELINDLAHILARGPTHIPFSMPGRDLAGNLADTLNRVPVDASGVDLTGIGLRDLDVLNRVTWTRKTTWPPVIAGDVTANSVEIKAGVYEIRFGMAHDPSRTPRVS